MLANISLFGVFWEQFGSKGAVSGAQWLPRQPERGLKNSNCCVQWIPAATLYRLVPVMFSQRMSVMARREESQFWYESAFPGKLRCECGGYGEEWEREGDVQMHEVT
jgi:hypothetical protein